MRKHTERYYVEIMDDLPKTEMKVLHEHLRKMFIISKIRIIDLNAMDGVES